MADALAHRGPNDSGFVFFDKNGITTHFKSREEFSGDAGSFVLGMGHRRLSILDLSPLGHQPMATEDERFWIIHNGEVYNYQSIREDLKGKGHRFRSDSDTEVILSAYREWGADCVARFNGMWVFMIYDTGRRELFISRDRFGIKPLFYAEHRGQLLFASEIKAFLAAGVDNQINDGIVYDYLSRGYNDHTDETFFTHIHSFPSGQSETISLDGARNRRRYWELSTDPASYQSEHEEADTIERFGELLADSVRLRLISDVPVGTCLSGGLDSSSIVMLISDILASTSTADGRLTQAVGSRQRAFSACYHDDGADESGFSELAATTAGAERHQVFPTGREFWSDIPRLTSLQDEPFGSTSIYAQYRVMGLVREKGVTVVLDGQGADEALAGYPGYRGRWLAELLTGGRVARFLSESLGRGMGPGERSVALLGAAFNVLLPLLPKERKSGIGWRFLTREFQDSHREREQALNALGRVRNLTEQLSLDTLRRSLPALLRYEDRNSMAFSLESRVPFLDYRLVELAFRIPGTLKIHDGYTKYVLRLAMNGTLPDEITWRKDKKGFTTPERRWLFHDASRLKELIRDEKKLSRYIDREKACEYVDSVIEGTGGDTKMIWRWMNMSLWLASLGEG